MSKVKIQGNASGSGVLTIAAPNTSTDRTVTLPDSTGTLLDTTSGLDATKLSGNLPAISGASLTSLPVQKINPNLLINGGFDVAQRGTTISGIGSAKYTLDRWTAISSGADSTVTQVSGATYPKALRLTGAGSTSGTYLQQKIESKNSRHLAGQTATFSVYLRASTAINIEFSIKYATSDDNFGGTTSIASTTFNVTTTDTKFTWTGSIPSAATTGIQVELQISSQGSAWYEASNAKLELGSTATDFEHRSYGEELALCQRYYESTNTTGRLAYIPLAFYTTSAAYGNWYYKIEKRTTPTITFNGLNWGLYKQGDGIAETGVTTDGIGVTNACIVISSNNGFTAGESGFADNRTANAITADAEL